MGASLKYLWILVILVGGFDMIVVWHGGVRGPVLVRTKHSVTSPKKLCRPSQARKNAPSAVWPYSATVTLLIAAPDVATWPPTTYRTTMLERTTRKDALTVENQSALQRSRAPPLPADRARHWPAQRRTPAHLPQPAPGRNEERQRRAQGHAQTYKK